MRAAKLTIFLIGISLSSLAFSQVGENGRLQQKKIREKVLRHFNASYSESFIQHLKEYNRQRNKPQKMIENIKSKEARELLKKYFSTNNIQKLPKLSLKGEVATFKTRGVTVKFSVLDSYLRQLRVNGHLYKFSPQQSAKEIFKDFRVFLKTNVGLTSSVRWWDVLLPQAHAAESGFHLTLGSIMLLNFNNDIDEAKGWGTWFGYGGHGMKQVNNVVKMVREQKNECQRLGKEHEYDKSDLAVFDSNSLTDSLVDELDDGYYSDGEVKALSQELMGYLKGREEVDIDKTKYTTPCQKMGATLFQVASERGSNADEYNTKKGTTHGIALYKKHKKEAVIEMCRDMSELRMCLAKFNVSKVKIDSSERREYNSLIENYRDTAGNAAESLKDYKTQEK